MLRALLITAVAGAETTLIAVLRRMQFERGGVKRWGSLWISPRLEVWARRHVLVHNRGLADDKYVAGVPGALVGTLLEVDSEYLGTAIDLLCGFVLGVILTAWASRPSATRSSCATPP